MQIKQNFVQKKKMSLLLILKIVQNTLSVMDSKVLKGYLISLAIIGRIVESIFDMRNVV